MNKRTRQFYKQWIPTNALYSNAEYENSEMFTFLRYDPFYVLINNEFYNCFDLTTRTPSCFNYYDKNRYCDDE